MLFCLEGHVASEFELWTLLSNCLVTILSAALLGISLYNRCYQRRRNIVAAMDIEDTPDNDVEAGEQDGFLDASHQTSFTEFVYMVEMDTGPTPSAPSLASSIKQ